LHIIKTWVRCDDGRGGGGGGEEEDDGGKDSVTLIGVMIIKVIGCLLMHVYMSLCECMRVHMCMCAWVSV
jgi:hypothetical protein